MRAQLLTVARRAAVVASRRTFVAPQGVTLFRAVAARGQPLPVRLFQTNAEVVEEVNKPPPAADGGPFAVDAPDGEHDKEDLEEHKKAAEEIIGFAATHEDASTIAAEHAAGSAKDFAVDAPDGEHDQQALAEHQKAAEEIIGFAAEHEDAGAINADHEAGAATAFAVDAPDGEHDLEDVEEHGAQVASFIDDAATLENPDEIKRQQQLRDATLVEAEKHPEKDL